MTRDVDLLIIGGGINGAGIARDAAGRGLSVLLAEQHDFAKATSSSSSKLIHGGLRRVDRICHPQAAGRPGGPGGFRRSGLDGGRATARRKP